MGFIEIFLIGVGLSMDAFAVSVCKGLGMKKLNRKQALVIAVFFGVFQGVMPLIGWALGKQFEFYITSIDHWVAFGLLVLIGGKMLWDSFRPEDDCGCGVANDTPLDYKELVMLAIATSIDALAIGITLAFLQVDIIGSAAVIGVTTFALSLVGVVVGNRFGARYEKPATIIGGIVLIAIGAKILLEHLGLLSF
ncbi:MAG: manganese efflux pump MntP family protein [Raoultibacter sp.]